MAKLTIEIEENEFALYDYEVYVNGVLVLEDGQYTSESVALTSAREAVRGLRWNAAHRN